METKVYLKESYFVEKETEFLSNGSLKASLFTYSTGVKAVRLSNEKGNLVMLPYMGQMIWRMTFLGKELTMKSIYDEPMPAKETYGETYGCFLMHCGLTAMGNPTPADTHLPHGELPVATYRSAWIISGEDEKGKYLALGGVYSHKRCYETNYDFMPQIKLYEGATSISIDVAFTNNKDLPLEYFYLCHINHRPVNGSKLSYSATHEKTIVNHEVPDNFDPVDGAKTNAFLDKLDKDPSLMDTVGREDEAYMPEIVFCLSYSADKDGNAYTMQVMPEGDSVYVVHRPEELPFGIRWISRTGDEDSMGMVLPSTAEHRGYLYCKEKGYERYLKTGETVTYHMVTGLMNNAEADALLAKIKSMGY